MGYATVSGVRNILGITDTSVIPDSRISPYLTEADKTLLEYVATRVKDEVMVGSQDGTKSQKIDGSNKEFYVRHWPIADVNFDKVVDKNDIHVYTWTDSDDEDTKTEVSVYSVNGNTGRVVLVEAPSTDVEVVTCDYHYYNWYVDFDLLVKAANLLAAHSFVVSEFVLMPAVIREGSLSFRHGDPQEKIWREFKRVLTQIRKKPFRVKKAKEIYKEAWE